MNLAKACSFLLRCQFQSGVNHLNINKLQIKQFCCHHHMLGKAILSYFCKIRCRPCYCTVGFRFFCFCFVLFWKRYNCITQCLTIFFSSLISMSVHVSLYFSSSFKLAFCTIIYPLSLSLSLSLTRTHTHTFFYSLPLTNHPHRHTHTLEL